jgi:hypothetical protein
LTKPLKVPNSLTVPNSLKVRVARVRELGRGARTPLYRVAGPVQPR